MNNRQESIKKLTSEEFDLLIIGGGITGAGIALDASSRGMKVALVEKNDFASGTSSKSTKLIHGGLRYLKQFDFWLVKEVGSERAIVHKLAPHLVIPEKMILPLIKNGTYGSWLTSIGLKIYDILASVEGDDKRKMLDKKEALKIEPLLPEKILEGAGYYAEYRTDDARLTLEVIKTALNYNAVALNYCKANEFIYEEEKVRGVEVEDLIANKKFKIKAKYVVNATGPWVDTVRQINHSKIGKRLHLTKGVHLVIAHEKLPINQAVYFDVPDGRMMFAIPRGKITYIGTTDTNYQEDKDNVAVSAVDAVYLISAVNNMFPTINLTLDDIQSSWAGLRPLIHEEGKSASELSRKDEIFVSETELISIAGGKLTGYRKMAERIVDIVAKKYKKRYEKKYKSIKTEKITLTGGDFKNYKKVIKYQESVFEQLKSDGFSQKDVNYLVHNYGTQTDEILKKYQEIKSDNAQISLAKAELWFSLNYEMAQTPSDFFIRRTGRLYFDIESIKILKTAILNEFKSFFNWDDKTLKKHELKLDQAVHEATNFTH
ncbi:glycerol-3-phosphate dehydrogenase/oxidase [Urechidicola croceus]|uniref:Glycerol-3-phosphate dehydrogenase n=1 Tax=Urechidicola croceus TaxID=1850246 RepID=A0A1D8P931_9FLAO|nr:glycerol-3-phosphate dehydrogenase/oxidase [Urechidicola croceus]AOW21074.1 glycerol-3-phosphate dehydrogenase [Urechidicola croceus]